MQCRIVRHGLMRQELLTRCMYIICSGLLGSGYNEHSKSMDEILKKLAELQKKNNALLRRYNGDAKFARVHKRIREENFRRKNSGRSIILSEFDESIATALMAIKSTVDRKVYDRNDILCCCRRLRSLFVW